MVVPIKEESKRVQVMSRSVPTQQHSSSDYRKVVLKSRREVAHVWALSHTERRRRRAPVKGLLTLEGVSACVFMWFQKTSYTTPNPGRSRGVKQGAIEEGKYEGKAGDMPRGGMYEC
jgi:hypothetical protein